MLRDKYDEAIEYLVNQDNFFAAVAEAWANPRYYAHQGGCLFQATRWPGTSWPLEAPALYPACLTQIRRYGDAGSPVPELTRAIRADVRIPPTPEEITRESLAVFAEWQRFLDNPFVAPTPASIDRETEKVLRRIAGF